LEGDDHFQAVLLPPGHRLLASSLKEEYQPAGWEF
jgi:hypothetical protein